MRKKKTVIADSCTLNDSIVEKKKIIAHREKYRYIIARNVERKQN